nr:hypothetical protein [Angustibacter aerolatus]
MADDVACWRPEPPDRRRGRHPGRRARGAARRRHPRGDTVRALVLWADDRSANLGVRALGAGCAAMVREPAARRGGRVPELRPRRRADAVRAHPLAGQGARAAPAGSDAVAVDVRPGARHPLGRQLRRHLRPAPPAPHELGRRGSCTRPASRWCSRRRRSGRSTPGRGASSDAGRCAPPRW